MAGVIAESTVLDLLSDSKNAVHKLLIVPLNDLICAHDLTDGLCSVGINHMRGGGRGGGGGAAFL